MGTISEADLNTCLKTLESCGKGAADGDRAEESRMLDVLKQLQKRAVTADLLKRTNAGKRLNKFCKHSCESVSQAAKAAVEAWKQCVKQEQQQADSGDLEASEVAAQRGAPASTSQMVSRAPPAKPSVAPSGSGAGFRPAQPSPQPPQRQASSSFTVDPPRCGNDTRDKVRIMLAEALAVGFNGGGGPSDGDAGAFGTSSLQSPNLLAASIEEALYELLGGGGSSVSGEYKAKARSLCFNLKDAKNPDLRERVLSGSIPPETLVRMSAEEMASDEQKRKNRELKDFLAKEATRGVNNTATTDMFQCGRCKQRKCTYYQMQTRSADEPMTTFVTCINCGQRWKFC
ncbi:hypothetical protein Vretimale_6533 [Volvox reticuliferus]|uniref:Transcription elongation factor n=1 Tax=Volvox reticuliferus TaxID=1737510 RepID=A0A8J4G808_9CHLO|nr:hypothetical protein Vretifemale_7401 [Volvox reticuliferus]GIM01750.1 hypothetical protein Vretimale_6533 [Volvox reticuliferus]